MYVATGRSDRSDYSISPRFNQPQVNSNALAVNESVHDKDDYSAYSKDVRAAHTILKKSISLE